MKVQSDDKPIRSLEFHEGEQAVSCSFFVIINLSDKRRNYVSELY